MHSEMLLFQNYILFDDLYLMLPIGPTYLWSFSLLFFNSLFVLSSSIYLLRMTMMQLARGAWCGKTNGIAVGKYIVMNLDSYIHLARRW